MVGIIFAVLSGFFIALQNVFNATIGTEVSIWSTAMITQAVGGAGALLIYLFKKDEEFRGIRQVKPLYLFGGSFGALVVASSVIAVSYIGAAVTNASILLGQLGIVVLIETFGFFNMNKQPIARKQIIGLAVMMIGAILISI
mgnify:CR=1 FL=1